MHWHNAVDINWMTSFCAFRVQLHTQRTATTGTSTERWRQRHGWRRRYHASTSHAPTSCKYRALFSELLCDVIIIRRPFQCSPIVTDLPYYSFYIFLLAVCCSCVHHIPHMYVVLVALFYCRVLSWAPVYVSLLYGFMYMNCTGGCEFFTAFYHRIDHMRAIVALSIAHDGLSPAHTFRVKLYVLTACAVHVHYWMFVVTNIYIRTCTCWSWHTCTTGWFSRIPLLYVTIQANGLFPMVDEKPPEVCNLPSSVLENVPKP